MKIIGKLSTAKTDIKGKTEISHKSYHNPSRLDKSNAWFRFWYLTNINIIDGGWILLALSIEWQVSGSQYLKEKVPKEVLMYFMSKKAIFLKKKYSGELPQ